MGNLGVLLAWIWLGVKAVTAVVIIYFVWLEIKTFKKKHKKPENDVSFDNDLNESDEDTREKQ